MRCRLTHAGHTLRATRHARGKSLAVVAGLAGITESYLSRLERGERALDRQSLVAALASALDIAPSELTALPTPAPDNGDVDSAIDAVRQTLLAVSYDMPGGQVYPVEALEARVAAAVDTLCRAERDKEVGAALPGLIRDLHTSIQAGKHDGAMHALAAWLHTQATASWLSLAGAPLDLRSQAITLAHRHAAELDKPIPMGLVSAAGARVLLAAGAFQLAEARVAAVDVPTDTSEGMQLAGFLALRRSVIASADDRPGDVEAPLTVAEELADRTGEGNAYGLGFGPVNTRLYRMNGLLEGGHYTDAVAVAESINPYEHVNRSRQAAYWSDYGRALARLRGRREEALTALRTAEQISPQLIRRGSEVRQVVSELLSKNHNNRELRGLAYRCGLRV